jgi:hypothetical protein
MMMDQSLASLVTRERDDYFGRFFHSLGVQFYSVDSPLTLKSYSQ